MAMLRLTEPLLRARDQEFNLGLLVPHIAEMMAGIMTEETLKFGEEFSARTGRWPDPESIDVRWLLSFATVATRLPDFLADAYEDLYGEDGPVSLGVVTDYRLSDDRNAIPDTIIARVNIDGARLLALARHYGLTRIFDGHGQSGFTRTATDAYWAQAVTLMDLQHAMESLPEDKFQEFFREDVANVIDFGEQARILDEG